MGQHMERNFQMRSGAPRQRNVGNQPKHQYAIDKNHCASYGNPMDLPQLIEELKRSLRYQQTLGLQAFPKGGAMASKSAAPIAASQSPNSGDKAQHLEKIRQTIGDCKRCKLCKARKNIVFGVGNPNAELMFVGEGPGRDEDTQGEPFVGRAGPLLNKIIEAM